MGPWSFQMGFCSLSVARQSKYKRKNIQSFQQTPQKRNLRSINITSTNSIDTHVLYMSFCSLVPLLSDY